MRAAQTLGLAEFTAQLETLASAIDAADAAGAARLASSIPAVENVLVGRDALEVRLDWLRDALRAPETDRKTWQVRKGELASRLRGMTREARAAIAVPAQPADARAALDRVLADRAFVRARDEAWPARLRERIARWLADVWARGFGRYIGPRRAAVVFAWTAAIAAIVVLLIWLTRLASRRRAERPVAIGTVEPRRAPARELALEAAALVRAGQVREGARSAYRASVRRLEEEGAFRVDEARTPREYLGLLPPPHRRRATLAALTATFERIWYGSRVAGPDEGEKILALLQDLECLSRDHAN